jgi:hypothetical protein
MRVQSGERGVVAAEDAGPARLFDQHALDLAASAVHGTGPA